MKVSRRKPGRFLIGIAVILLLFWGGTLAVSFGIASFVRPSESAVSSVFSAVTPPAHTSVSCLCVSCGAHDGAGNKNCCCAGAKDTGEALTIRTVCDTPIEAVIAGSILPPFVLPRAVSIRSTPLATSGNVFPVINSERNVGNGSPLPPDVPPRFS